MTDTSTDAETVQNRSEIVFLFDAVDCNPNGNPLSDSDRPRIDAQTQQAIVTDVRLKRYIRDQFHDDDAGVYIMPPSPHGNARTRTELLASVLKEELGDINGPEDIDSTIYDEFLAQAIDVRLFGATLSFTINEDTDEYLSAAAEHLPQHLTGPVQFSPGRSLHPVQMNEDYNSLTSVIATKEGKEQGGFDLDDHRIKYGLIRFHGLVNENAAAETNLSPEDIERLDTTVWRSLKNQTQGRSKMGQEPRIYLRVEYAQDNFHLGGLHDNITLDNDRSKPSAELRNIRDACIDCTDLVQRLEKNADRIKSINLVVSDAIRVSIDGEEGDDELLRSKLAEATGDVVNTPDVYATME